MAARTFSTEARKDYAARGVAMPDGSFPIPDCDAVRRAVASIGRAGAKGTDRYERVRRHIVKRARALGCTEGLPDDWRGRRT